MRIVLDAMGSDHAPAPEVQGAVDASLSGEFEIILVGPEDRLTQSLAGYKKKGAIQVVHAPDSIRMTDSPMEAARKKKDSSMHVGLRMVKRGEADAFVSAGNTGAVMICARTILRSIPGVARSAICQVLPSAKGEVVVLDLGANVDCTAKHLCQFAEMGMVYSRDMVGVENPRVGLLNIGEEQLKGNELSKAVHQHLTAAPHINFIGNVEPKALFAGAADVVVCDGFVGNVVLKTGEGVATLVTNLVKREIKATMLSRMGALLSLGAFKRIKRIVDPNEHHGAPLLGVQGTVIILHGASNALGIANGLRGAALALKRRVNDHIRIGIEELRTSDLMLESLEEGEQAP